MGVDPRRGPKRGACPLSKILMGDAASCGRRGQTLPKGYYNIESMLKAVVGREGRIGVCGWMLAAPPNQSQIDGA
jgi:uncharacterized protein involved in oxidation of intracellular sulfur